MGFVNSARDPLTETQMRCNPNGGVELQEKNKKSREVKSRENVRENNKKFIENNIRRKKVKIKNIEINTKLSKSCYVIKYYYILIYYLYNAI